MPGGTPALSSADVMKRVLLAAVAVWLGGVLRLAAQNPTPTPTLPPTPTPTPGQPSTVPAGVRYATENSANVNGVRVKQAPDGSVWFLEASADRVGVLRGTVITYWQLRPTDDLGANPVDFILDGTTVWILESGQSQVVAGPVHDRAARHPDEPGHGVRDPGLDPRRFPPRARWNLVGSDHGSRAAERQPRHRRDHRPPLGPDDLVLGHGRRCGRHSLAGGFRQQPHREIRARSGDRDVLDVLPPGLRPAQSDAGRLRRPGQALAFADLGRPDGSLRSRDRQPGFVLWHQCPGPLRFLPGERLRHLGPGRRGRQHHRPQPGGGHPGHSRAPGARRPVDSESHSGSTPGRSR